MASPRTSKRKTTVPEPFHYQSDERAQQEVGDGKKQEDKRAEVTLAQSEDVLKRDLRDGKDERVKAKRESKLPKPQSPTFHGSKVKTVTDWSVKPNETNENSSDDTSAQSFDVLRSGLRHSDPIPAGAPRQQRVSLIVAPQSPRFRQSHARDLPKSSEELEEEMLQEIKSKAFKAKPAPKFTSSPTRLDRKKAPPTKPQPFHFASEDRIAEHAKTADRPLTMEDIDLLECEKKFKALPLPDHSHILPPATSSDGVSSRRHTEPQPFHFRIDDRLQATSVIFKARPLPQTTYSPPRTMRGIADVKEVDVPPPPQVEKSSTRSPHFAVSTASAEARATEAHRVMDESDHRSTKEEAEARRLHELAEKAKPFQLQSLSRHEEYKRHLEERTQKEEDEFKKKAQFRALPLRQSPVRTNVRKEPRTTELQPFELKSVARHEDFELSLQRKLAMEEEERKKQATFKARPLPGKKKSNKLGESARSSHSVVATSEAKVFTRKAFGQIPLTTGVAAFLLTLIIRLLNTLVVQSYFDPDEFWQALEPAYCKVFSDGSACPGLTWEWIRRAPNSVTNPVERSMLGPARSYLPVIPTYILYIAAKVLHYDSYWLVSRGPMLLNAILVAVPVDLCVWNIAQVLEPNGKTAASPLTRWCLFCSLVSWFNGYSLVRTFANSQETLFLVLALWLVCPELVGNLNGRLPFVRSSLAFFLGGLSVAIRFTSVAAFAPMGLLLALRHVSISDRLRYLIVPCAVFGAAGIAVALCVDRFFYGFWTLPFLGNFHFNVILNSAELYGSHPWHWYFTAGLPAISGLLFPLLLVDFIAFLRGKLDYGKRNLWIISLSYLSIMSFNAHKEFRFIHPVLPLVCLLVGSRLRAIAEVKNSRIFRATVLSAFVVANLIVLIYLGLFHQSAPIHVNRRIVELAGTAAALAPTKKEFSIYYFTGSCHSTPLHSHLHAPPLQFRTRSLDCSPACRSDPNSVCETDRFIQNPERFVLNSLANSQVPTSEGEKTCSQGESARHYPDFVVTFSSYVEAIRPHLERVGLTEAARFPHRINGVKLKDFIIGESFRDGRYRHFGIHGIDVEVSVDEMVLFAVDQIVVGEVKPGEPVSPYYDLE